MVLDSKEQQEIILAAINACSFRGDVIEQVMAVKNAVQEATIKAVEGPTVCVA